MLEDAQLFRAEMDWVCKLAVAYSLALSKSTGCKEIHDVMKKTIDAMKKKLGKLSRRYIAPMYQLHWLSRAHQVARTGRLYEHLLAFDPEENFASDDPFIPCLLEHLDYLGGTTQTTSEALTQEMQNRLIVMSAKQENRKVQFRARVHLNCVSETATLLHGCTAI